MKAGSDGAPKRRHTIVVSAEPGRPARFRWEISSPSKHEPRLASGYLFATRQAAILDARFFLIANARAGYAEIIE